MIKQVKMAPEEDFSSEEFVEDLKDEEIKKKRERNFSEGIHT